MDSGHIAATQVTVVGSLCLAPWAAKACLLGARAGERASTGGEAGAHEGRRDGQIPVTTEVSVARCCRGDPPPGKAPPGATSCAHGHLEGTPGSHKKAFRGPGVHTGMKQVRTDTPGRKSGFESLLCLSLLLGSLGKSSEPSFLSIKWVGKAIRTGGTIVK